MLVVIHYRDFFWYLRGIKGHCFQCYVIKDCDCPTSWLFRFNLQQRYRIFWGTQNRWSHFEIEQWCWCGWKRFIIKCFDVREMFGINYCHNDHYILVVTHSGRNFPCWSNSNRILHFQVRKSLNWDRQRYLCRKKRDDDYCWWVFG